VKDLAKYRKDKLAGVKEDTQEEKVEKAPSVNKSSTVKEAKAAIKEEKKAEKEKEAQKKSD
jgi:hypothetical protein